MVKLQNKSNRKSKKALQLKKLSEQVPQQKYQKYQQEELLLFENDNQNESDQSVKQEQQNSKKEEDENINQPLTQEEDSAQWVDEFDEKIQVDLSKQTKLRKLIKNGQNLVTGKEYQRKLREFYKNSQQNNEFLSWAQSKQQIKQEKDKFDQNQLNANLKELLSQNIQNQTIKSSLLPNRIIQIEQAGIIKAKINTVIQSISFHKKLPIFAEGGFDKLVRIYQFNPNKQIQLIKSIGLEKFPICKLQFMNENNNIIVASPFKTYLIEVDINTQKYKRIQSTLFAKHFNQSGKYNRQIEFAISEDDKYIALFNESGYIHILSGDSKILLNEFKQNEACKAVTFADEFLISAGQGGKIYQWSLQKQQIYNVFHNPGGFEVNCLDFKQDLLAVGSRTGIVNIFKLNSSTKQFNKEPIKEIQNLTTSVNEVQFNKFCEILCISSKWKDSAIKLVHVDTFTVFENWPTVTTCLKKISAIGISNDSRFLVIGNEDGELRAFRLLHY
ncbi:unnamed protein product [Paramecium pentaurelia]|uniref:WD40-repeat-containing domain n=1 Tax=Paramecium pentaurelia TaxID=43138 RepID=A0A8S1UPV2_9CILI|nr:unnamed protein product [Paramecium pentaurelia]